VLAAYNTWRYNTPRTVKDTSLLAHALLGLLQQEPRSGYDLRKIFANTPMGTFSDSPGAIYPALERLAKRGYVRSQVQEASGLRRRRVFRPTASGKRAFKAWQTKTIVREDVIYGVDELMLRFSFMDETASGADAKQFLSGLRNQLAGYIPTLRKYLQKHRGSMSLSGRLALESGIRGYESLFGWVKTALSAYGRRKARGVRR
jgi:DNA-binding PadR family transcriptional regulator